MNTYVHNLLSAMTDDIREDVSHEILMIYCKMRKTEWYTRICEKEGKDAAESKLFEVLSDRHNLQFANSIEPIIHGLLALASTAEGEECIRVVKTEYGDDSDMPLLLKELGMANISGDKIIYAEIPEQPAFDSRELRGQRCFDQIGELGLIAIIVATKYMSTLRSLSLVLKHRKEESGFVVCTISPDGNLYNHSYFPNTTAQGFLEHKLGIIREVPTYACRGGGDNTIGFPCAEKYLAENIDQLGPFLTELAESLTREV